MNLRHLFTAAAAALTLTVSADSAPKYIFYFIGDGMGMGQVMATMAHDRIVGDGDGMLNFTSLPVASMATTYSASTPVTDSAAAGTALATGHKTNNGMLGMDADTISVNSVAKHLHDLGYGVGIITTVAADDATPGAFYAHVPKRSMYYEIGRQAAESGYELIGGASFRGLVDKKGNDTGLRDYIASQGVALVEGLDALRATNGSRAMLVPDVPVWDWNAGYAIDSIPGALNLRDMLLATIDHISITHPDSFFIMAEGGSIDHAGHANDPGCVIRETIAFDEAVGEALKFYEQHPDETLIVVTADHETGGLSVGNLHTRYAAYPQYLTAQRYSKERFSNLCDSLQQAEVKPTWDEMKAMLEDGFGLGTVIPVTDKQWERLEDVYADVFIGGNTRRQETLYAAFNQMAVEVYELISEISGFGWTTLAHSGNPVPVYAIGVGSEAFIPMLDNTQIPKNILKLVTTDKTL